jgi:hypothetical protein
MKPTGRRKEGAIREDVSAKNAPRMPSNAVLRNLGAGRIFGTRFFCKKWFSGSFLQKPVLVFQLTGFRALAILFDMPQAI